MVLKSITLFLILLTPLLTYSHSSKIFNNAFSISPFEVHMNEKTNCGELKCNEYTLKLNYEYSCSSHLDLFNHKYDRKSRTLYIHLAELKDDSLTCNTEPEDESFEINIPNIRNEFLNVKFMGTKEEISLKVGQKVMLSTSGKYITFK